MCTDFLFHMSNQYALVCYLFLPFCCSCSTTAVCWSPHPSGLKSLSHWELSAVKGRRSPRQELGFHRSYEVRKVSIYIPKPKSCTRSYYIDRWTVVGFFFATFFVSCILQILQDISELVSNIGWHFSWNRHGQIWFDGWWRVHRYIHQLKMTSVWWSCISSEVTKKVTIEDPYQRISVERCCTWQVWWLFQ